MKTNKMFAEGGMTLIQIVDKFPTDDAAREHLEGIRWKDGIVCPHCGCKDQTKFSTIAANPAKKVRAGLRWCSACEKQFTVTIGTIFEDSHIPLRKWLIAWYMICSSKKGISSLQLQRQLELGSYRSALFMTHRIRFALRDPAFNTKLKGTVEADETWVGGKVRGMSGNVLNKTAVVSLVQRGGDVRSKAIGFITAANLKAVVNEHVDKSATLMTDELTAYRRIGKEYARHAQVTHSAREYVRGDAHVNSAESFFSLLKRGVYGTFHHVSRQYLGLYLAEFDHRYNHRKISDGDRTVAGLRKTDGKRLYYRRPKGA